MSWIIIAVAIFARWIVTSDLFDRTLAIVVVIRKFHLTVSTAATALDVVILDVASTGIPFLPRSIAGIGVVRHASGR
jgi:hypothetical protein